MSKCPMAMDEAREGRGWAVRRDEDRDGRRRRVGSRCGQHSDVRGSCGESVPARAHPRLGTYQDYRGMVGPVQRRENPRDVDARAG